MISLEGGTEYAAAELLQIALHCEMAVHLICCALCGMAVASSKGTQALRKCPSTNQNVTRVHVGLERAGLAEDRQEMRIAQLLNHPRSNCLKAFAS